MLCITEMWLNSDVADAEVSFENYNISLTYFEETDILADEGEASLSMSELLPRRFSLYFDADSSFVEVVSYQTPHPSQLRTVFSVYRSSQVLSES